MLHRLLFALTCLASLASAQGPSLFRDHIRPLLEKTCFGCHSQKVKMGGLDMTTRASLLKGSEHGPVIVAGDPESSQLYKLVAHISEPGMPFKAKKLPDDAIAKIAEWIKAGSPYGDATDAEGIDLKQASGHWAFQQPRRPPVPKAKNTAWVRNPIDAFVAVEHEKRGLQPLPETDKRTLLRRVYLDLTGLPPTVDQVSAFLADSSKDAYEKAVTSLLDSPAYGERWGRHWLDVWRYSDWYGYRKSGQVRYSQRHIWRWRDWTVEALNRNKGYARMIQEMIAGDELAPEDPDTVRATGYLARNWYMFNRNVWLQDTVEYTAFSFLGLTLKCARCHTHKYDPIPQTDYYRFRAFFEPEDVRIDRVAGEADTVKNGVARIYDADAARPTYRFFRGNENNPDTANALQPGVPQLFGKLDLEITPVTLPRDAWFPDGRPFVPDDMRAQAKAEVEKAEAALRKAHEELAKQEKAEKPDAAATRKAQVEIQALEKRVAAAKAAIPALEARIEADRASMMTPVPENAEALAERARHLERTANAFKAEEKIIRTQFEFEKAKGDEKKLGAAATQLEAAVAALNEPKEGYTSLGPKYPTTSSGRRTALAKWIGAKDNPLTARVAINHMWMRHFGKPLVPTVFNFGKSGKPPSHPELMDWLAVQFMDSGWDMKAMHRLMVLSSTYRMRSSGWTAQTAAAKADPDNIYLWRGNIHRMEAEAVRDSVLKLAGKLDPTMGGAELDESKGDEIYRRSLYFRHAPDLQMDMLKVFDVASPNECFQRSESIIPQQALALANSRLSLEMARVITANLGASRPPEQFAGTAFETILARPASAAELAEAVNYLKEQSDLYRGAALEKFQAGPEAKHKPSSDPDVRARESLVHVLLNHNDFVTVR